MPWSDAVQLANSVIEFINSWTDAGKLHSKLAPVSSQTNGKQTDHLTKEEEVHKQWPLVMRHRWKQYNTGESRLSQRGKKKQSIQRTRRDSLIAHHFLLLAVLSSSRWRLTSCGHLCIGETVEPWIKEAKQNQQKTRTWLKKKILKCMHEAASYFGFYIPAGCIIHVSLVNIPIKDPPVHLWL